jgi:NADH-quinone oxidoreductase subunit N
MSLGTFFIMRHELLLIAAALLVLIAEIFMEADKKRSIMLFSVILFGVVTISGFLPSPTGTLFGGMYISS